MPVICGHRAGVKRMPTKSKRSSVEFPYALRSFIGYLEGTQKSAHTIKNYRLDILAFQDFIKNEFAGKTIRLESLSRSDIERYRDFLKEKGFKTNTRRRKLLTVTQFLNYLAKRKKLSPEMSQKVPAPNKIERIPVTVPIDQLLQSIRALPIHTLLDARNQALLWTLAESGCLVSEIPSLRFESWARNSLNSAVVRLGGKELRPVPVSIDLYEAIQALKARTGGKSNWIFLGFNKFGSLGAPITSRGVEMLVKHYGPRLGMAQLTPRTFRHSVILHWFEQGVPQAEIQARLGLKTTYAFRSYEPLLRSSSKTTSIAETTQQES
jgi:site-specific recombinase XerD